MNIPLSYGLYMAEAEGYLNTRESRIQEIIYTIKHCSSEIIYDSDFYVICHMCGVSRESLTNAEIIRIQNAIQN